MFNSTNYINIPGWMITDLGLNGNELLVYAIIYGFSQDGTSKYCGSARYIAESLSLRKGTVLAVLARLVAKGLLEKSEKEINGVRMCDYKAIHPGGGTETVPVVRKPYRGGTETVPGGGTETVPHNNSIDNTRDNIPPIAPQGADAPKPSQIDSDFEEFWSAYTPAQTRDGVVGKGPKKLARERYHRARASGAKHADIMDGAKKYLDYCKSCDRFTCSVSVFLSQERWKDEYKTPTKRKYL